MFLQSATGTNSSWIFFLFIAASVFLIFAAIAVLRIAKVFFGKYPVHGVLSASLLGISHSFMLLCFVVPLYSLVDHQGKVYQALRLLSWKEAYSIPIFTGFIVFALLSLVSLFLSVYSLRDFFSGSDRYPVRAERTVFFNLLVTTVFAVFGTVSLFIEWREGHSDRTFCYVPVLLEIIVSLAFSFANSLIARPAEKLKIRKRQPGSRWLILLFVVLFLAAGVAASFLEIAEVRFTSHGTEYFFRIRGVSPLKIQTEPDFQTVILAFLSLSALVLLGFLGTVSVMSVISGSSSMRMLCTSSIVIDCVVVLAFGLFGKYYEIVQIMNIERLEEVFSALSGYSAEFDTVVSVKSQTFYLIFVAAGLSALLAVFKPFTAYEKRCREIDNGSSGSAEPYESTETCEVSGNADEVQGADVTTAGDVLPEASAASPESATESHNGANGDFIGGRCPAFEDADMLIPSFRSNYGSLSALGMQEPSLPVLVSHVCGYARESKKHLSYTPEDIATFVAGLGMSRLTILQGMSGTGKTSLPRIFAEALSGRCEIVEVESSWKDKNELLGYYNEFSKVYSPKKFTQALYKAVLTPDVPVFIVLDEMNLSRIEYYFSDFLSLMENDEDKRFIKLLNTRIYPEGKSDRHFAGLRDDTTIAVPPNVWFIGTANRDESTFEISDKVYDRANTMNFNKRAPKAVYSGNEVPKVFVSDKVLRGLFDEARRSFDFDVERNETVIGVEKLLSPYNISFGNRVSGQIEDFVRIYCSCFNDKFARIPEATEKILLSKVVHKLEFRNLRDRDALIRGFEKLRLPECASFIKGLGGESFYD